MRKAGEASPARDERLANLEQRDPRSGDARGLFVYHLFRKQMMGKQEHGDIEMIVCINRLKQFGIFSDFNGTKIQKFGRYNLVYGWNGTGKSTLSNLFFALSFARWFPASARANFQ